MAISRLIKEINNLKPKERERLFRKLGISSTLKNAKVKRRVLANPKKHERANTAPAGLKPIGFGMWSGREDFEDAAKWVRNLRAKEWQR